MDASAMSLDEIIKKKKIKVNPSRSNNRPKSSSEQGEAKVVRKPDHKIVDARNKIIQKNRSKIRDAREKISQKRIIKRSRSLGNRSNGSINNIPSIADARLSAIRSRGTTSRLTSNSNSRNNITRLKSQDRQRWPQGKQRGVSSYGLPSMKANTRAAPRPVPMRQIYVHDDVPYNNIMDMISKHSAQPRTNLSLRRTVKNDMYSSMPPLPDFSHISYERRRPASPPPLPPPLPPSPPPPQNTMWNSDPFDCYEIPTGRPADVSEPKHLARHFQNISMEPPRKGILRSSREIHEQHRFSPDQHHQRRFSPDEHSQLSYEMRSRLERPPEASKSMGIFSNPYNLRQHQEQQHTQQLHQQQIQHHQYPIQQKPLHHQQIPLAPKLSSQSSLAPLPPSSTNGCRIVVSNLHSSVSESDIKELFEDIGELMEAKLVRPGVAVVIFNTIKDAETAVDTYHNRQLDGQPMKCLLVNPRSSNKPTAPAIKPARSIHKPSSSGQSPLEIDIDALHKVLFRRK